ncbi:4-(cytidine 5'-diphospho)-2-C-methyl-D-erythritol kinase [Hyphomicrobium sp. CS1BSMeth3]|uniref:4-(cytidine 5'-diphospho)-2-C-methyl-D-erythritol kinase n=1 Tax=Hyphomicrobium sp. CS1BSMeth3 TaxID=1892844 RepID=UPI000931726F|nr:4-(cytidine 5'-diphospho)-2-C-methyl-D-erythritol kinase [Hyphomicrobium sp. CS1BSMeth3]
MPATLPKVLVETARAKVNLTLSVLGRRPDGYHELESLVAFADVGDEVTLQVDAPVGVTVSGPFAGAIDSENIASRALRAVAEAAPSLRLGGVAIEKKLPVAAGIGGGSADAAAVLRAVRRANGAQASEVDWPALAASLGADVPVCLMSTAQFMWGIGRETASLPGIPALPAVLVNPGVPLATGPVFQALKAAPAPERDALPALPGPFTDITSAAEYIRLRGNDLEPAAAGLCPAIGTVLAALGAEPGVLAARMSGSGPTCFAIFGTALHAEAAAERLRAHNPGWWVVATTLT